MKQKREKGETKTNKKNKKWGNGGKMKKEGGGE